ncbi:MAG: pyruvate kinase, partial [Phenylobacterium sp.]|nr:pyruvate kinase [Phenylobacterium sp.]
MIRARRARIVATLGPASRDAVQIRALAEAGADVFRVNFSHGDHEDHARTIANVRAVEALVGRPLAVLADLQGPKLRLGEFADGRVRLKVGQDFRLDRDTAAGDASRVCVPHAEIFAALKPGADILLDDGKVRLKVGKCGPDFADTVVVAGEALSDHKGLNLPGLAIPIPALTPKDLEDIRWGIEQEVDFFAQSFVRQASDVQALAATIRAFGGSQPIIAKI